MKRIVIGTVLALLISVTAFAKALTITACTEDKKAVALEVVINDTIAAQHPVEDHITVAFNVAASVMTAEELLGEKGFKTFASQLDEIDSYAIEGLTAPTVTGSCK